MRTVRILEEADHTGAKRLILERFPYDIVAIELPEESVGASDNSHLLGDNGREPDGNLEAGTKT